MITKAEDIRCLCACAVLVSNTRAISPRAVWLSNTSRILELQSTPSTHKRRPKHQAAAKRDKEAKLGRARLYAMILKPSIAPRASMAADVPGIAEDRTLEQLTYRENMKRPSGALLLKVLLKI